MPSTRNYFGYDKVESLLRLRNKQINELNGYYLNKINSALYFWIKHHQRTDLLPLEYSDLIGKLLSYDDIRNINDPRNGDSHF